jgi:hypothetical protein
MELKTFELVINEDLQSQFEVDAIALVDIPATKSNWFTFKEEVNPMHFAQVNEDERIVVGAAMIPNFKMYRKDDAIGEYNVFFSEQTISQIAQKFFAKNYQNNANIMHDPEKKVQGLTYYMSWIKDEKKGIKGLEGDYPEGTWFVGAKVNDEETWNRIKSGEFKGFSVEGFFAYMDNEDEISDQDFAELLKNSLGKDATVELFTTLIN